jgi:hypothetical protein
MSKQSHDRIRVSTSEGESHCMLVEESWAVEKMRTKYLWGNDTPCLSVWAGFDVRASRLFYVYAHISDIFESKTGVK